MNFDETKPNYRSWNIQPLKEEETSNFKLLAENALTYATLAPSTHNTQPWQFIVRSDDRRIDFFSDPKYILQASDPTKREALISIGCCLQAFQIALQYYRFEASEELFPSRENPNHIASVTVPTEQNTEQGPLSYLLPYIPMRRTNRSRFDGTPIDPELLKSLESATSKHVGLKLNPITDSHTKSLIAYAQELADRHVLVNETFAPELSDWIIPNNSELGRGMPGSGFGLGDEGTIHTKVALALSSENEDLATGFARADGIGINFASAVLITSANADSRENWIAAGKSYMETTLLLTQKDYASAMMAAQVEIPIFNTKYKSKLMARNNHILIVHRVGKPTEERPHSPRVPIEEVTTWV